MSIHDEPKQTMRCILASSHGSDIDSLLWLCNDFPIPVRKKGEVLIKVCACALAPGDIRVLAGHVDYFQEPPNGFPYIPGGDISGTIVEADDTSCFKKGDSVFAIFELPRPLNGLAEFIAVDEKRIELAPMSIPLAHAAALPSALSAMIAANKHVNKGSRVLVLGGAGGLGTFFIQMAKQKGASYVAVTSTTDKKWLLELGADKVINYQKETWVEDEKFLSSLSGERYDLIVDLAVGKAAWLQVNRFKLLDKHGTFLAITMDKPLVEMHNLRQAIAAMAPGYLRMIRTKLSPFSPRYIWHENGLELKPGRLKEVARLVDDEGLKIVLHSGTLLPFSEQGVKRGFHVMQRRHAHGKVVISISEG